MERSKVCNRFEDATLASGYEAWYGGENRQVDALEKDLLGRLLDTFPRSRSILEIGCGTGHFTRWMAERGLDVVGLDASAAMLQEARRLGGPEYLRGDALLLPVTDFAYDVTALITTLEFLEDPERALSEAVRVSRHGLLLGVLNRWSVLALQYRLSGDPLWRSARFFGVLELAKLARRAAGGRARSVAWRTTLWPVPGLRDLPLPWGGFIGLALQLSEPES